MSKIKGQRLETEVERCRAECNWRRLFELIPHIRAKGSGLESLGNFLLGEYQLENFSDEQCTALGGYLRPDIGNTDPLRSAEEHLRAVLADHDAKPYVALESHLMLAKLHYLCADYDQAVIDVDNAKLERNDIQFQTLRTLRLVAEAYAIKGLSLEKLSTVAKSLAKYPKSQQSTQVLYCFEKAAELSLAYIQELEKAVPTIGSITGGAISGQLSLAVPHSTSSASASTPTAKPADKIGNTSSLAKHKNPFRSDLMETAIQRVPLMHIRAQMSHAQSAAEGVEWYRRILTETGDKPIAHHLHQKLSRQLAEVLLRGVPDASYLSPATHSQAVARKAQSLRFYFGPSRSHYCPESRLEEVMLALSVSEALAAREAVLSRSEEDVIARQESIMNVKAVQNLLTLVLSTIRQYQLLAGVLEKSMKFAYEDRFIWLQFSLSLMCLGRWARSSQVLSQCIDDTPDSERDPVQHMFAAKLHIEQLGQYDKGIEHAQSAIDLCQGGWLSGRAKLLLGLGHSLKTQMAASYAERQVGHRYTVRLFEDAAKSDPKDHLAEFFLALQLAMGRENDEALQHCEKSLGMHPEQPTGLMLLALLLTARGEHKDALDIVLDALDEFPNHYGLLVLRLKLEVGFTWLLKSAMSTALLSDVVKRLDGGIVINVEYFVSKHSRFDVVQSLLPHPMVQSRQSELCVNLQDRTDQALATARDLLLFWKTAGSDQCGGNDRSPAADRVHSSQSNMTDGPPGAPPSVIFSPPSLVGVALNTTSASSSHLAPIASMSALDVTDKESVMGGTSAALSEYGGAASTVSDSIGLASASSGQRVVHARFRVQANIWLELAQLFLEAGRIADVQRCVDEACQAFPNSHQTLYLKGRLLRARAASTDDAAVRSKCLSEAKACFLGALAIFPNHIPSLRHLAAVYQSDGNLRMAEKVLKDLVKIEPLDHESWHALGLILAEDRRYDQSAECLSTAAAVQETTPIMPFNVIPRVIHV